MKKKRINLPEWYLLRVTNQFPYSPSLFLFGGLSQKEKPFLQIKGEAKKALRAGYKKILLPCNWTQHSEFQDLKDFILENPSQWAIQIPLSDWSAFKKQQGTLLQEPELTFDFLLECSESLTDALIEDIKQILHFQITILAQKDISVKKLLESLPSFLYSKTCIHFPCFHKKHSMLYSSKEIYDFLAERFLPPPKTDIFNLSIPEDLKLEPEMEPDFYYEIPQSKPHISLIIPSYNSKKTLSLVLRHLARQTLAKENFEIIVIDDGSGDGTEEFLRELSFLKERNFKFSFFPREKKHRPGDHRFRAGIARNLGVKQAVGDILAFLDSDVLVGENWLAGILRAMEKVNVLQHPRYQLKPFAPKEYQKIHPENHIFIRGDGYWENFYKKGVDWNNLETPWKYISTNTLCVRRAVFEKVGRFRKNYTSYGFEDTDLGWRLYHTGEKFFLNPNRTYHIFRRSEFFHLNFFKQRLLGISAHIFFHNTHCLSGYQEFQHLIQKRGL